MGRSKSSKLKQLIADHNERLIAVRTANLPSEEALDELEELMRYSDQFDRQEEKVPHTVAMELLASHGWRRSRCTFDDMIKRQYGRTWYGSK